MISSRRGEAGMVTAETALTLPVIAAFMLVLLWLASVAITEVRLVDAARDAARAAARGEDAAAIEAQVAATTSADARVAVTRSSDEVSAAVSTVAEPPGWLFIPLPAIPLSASATTQAEADGG